MRPPTVDQYASYQLAKLQIANSGLIQGFLTKCAEAAYTPSQTLDALNFAARTIPQVAIEFEKCGLDKQAFGTPFGAPNMTKATHAAEAHTPVVGAAGDGAMQGVKNIANGLWGGAKATGGALLGAAGTAAKPLAWASDKLGITQHAQPAMQGFTDSLYGDAKAGMRDFTKAFNPAEAALPGSHNAERVLQHQREMRSRGQDWSANTTGVADYIGNLATSAAVGGATSKAMRAPGSIGRLARGAADIFLPNTRGTLGAAVGNTIGGVSVAGSMPDAQLDSAPATGTAPQAVSPPQAQNSSPSRGAFLTQGTTSTPPTAVPAAAQPAAAQPAAAQPAAPQPTVPPQPPAAQPSMGPATPPPPPAAVSTQPAAPGTQPSEKPPSPIEKDPNFEAVAGFVKQDPVQAEALGKKAMEQVSGAVGTAAGATELEALKKSGKLTLQGQKHAVTTLVDEGNYDWDQAFETVKNMDGWEQLGLWGGIGMAGLGLLHALSGGGGVGSLLMGVLGLGAAGFTAGQAGLFGQQGKDMTAGLTDTVGSMFGQQSPETAPAGAAPPAGEQPGLMADAMAIMKDPATAIPKAIAAFPEQPNSATKMLLKTLAAVDPAKAARMDKAVRFKWLGSEGEVARELKIPPHDAAKLMRHWEAFRAANPAAN